MEHLNSFLSAANFYTSQPSSDDNARNQVLRYTKILSVVDLRVCLVDQAVHELLRTLSDLLCVEAAASSQQQLLWELLKLVQHVAEQLPELRLPIAVDYSCLSSLTPVLAKLGVSASCQDRVQQLLGVLDELVAVLPVGWLEPCSRRLLLCVAELVCEPVHAEVRALAASVLCGLLATGARMLACLTQVPGLRKRLMRAVVPAHRGPSLLGQLCAAELLLLLTSNAALTSGAAAESVVPLPAREMDRLLVMIVSALGTSLENSDRRLAVQTGRLMSRTEVIGHARNSVNQLQPMLLQLSEKLSGSSGSVVALVIVPLQAMSLAGFGDPEFWRTLIEPLAQLSHMPEVAENLFDLVHVLHDKQMVDASKKSIGYLVAGVSRLLETETRRLLLEQSLSVVRCFERLTADVGTAQTLAESMQPTMLLPLLRPLSSTAGLTSRQKTFSAELAILTIRLASRLSDSSKDWLATLDGLLGSDEVLKALSHALVSCEPSLIEASLQIVADHHLLLNGNFSRFSTHLVSVNTRDAVTASRPPTADQLSQNQIAEISCVLERVKQRQDAAGSDGGGGEGGGATVSEVMQLYQAKTACLQSDVVAMQSALQSQADLNANSRRQLAEARSECYRSQQLLMVSEQRVDQLRTAANCSVAQRTCLERQLQEFVEHQRQLKFAAEEESQRCLKLTEQLQLRNESLVRAQQCLSETSELQAQLEGSMQQLQTEVQRGQEARAELQARLDSCQSALQLSQHECASKREENSTLELLCKSQEQTIAEKEQRTAQLTDEIAQLNDEISQLHKIKDMIHNITKGKK